MARSRNIKPGFFDNADLAECSIYSRLLFVGIWTIADRSGRLEDRPKKIKYQLLPTDDFDAEQAIAELAERGFLMRYEVNGHRYLQVVNWDKHQSPHYKEVMSEIPAPIGWEESPIVVAGVPEKQRQAVFDRDGRLCLECGATDDLTIDHIIPRTHGGTNDDDNLQTLCRRCNSSKNNRRAKANVGQSSANHEPTLAQRPSAADPPLIPRFLDSQIPGDSDESQAAAETVVEDEIELTPAERRVVGLVKGVRGMAAVPDSSVVLHLREVLGARASPPGEEALVLDAMRFRDRYNGDRANQPADRRWRGWKVAMTNWFSRTRDEPIPLHRNGNPPPDDDWEDPVHTATLAGRAYVHNA